MYYLPSLTSGVGRLTVQRAVVGRFVFFFFKQAKGHTLTHTHTYTKASVCADPGVSGMAKWFFGCTWSVY